MKQTNSKNDLKINNDTLYNKMTKPKTPFNCSKCGKGCFSVPNCLSCFRNSGFIEDSIFASNNGIKYDKGKTIEEQHKEIKTEKKKMITNNNRMKIEDIIKIRLQKGKKNPKKDVSWTDKRNQNKNYKANSEYNVGIVCNEESGLFGVDLDFYTKEGEEKYDPINNKKHKAFIDLFGEDYVKYFNTFTQRTPNGGIHLGFKHEEGLKQIQSKEYKIDTRGGDTNGYLVGFNSVVNGKKYEVILNKELQPLPKELKDFLFNVVAVDNGTKIKQPKQTKGTRLSKAVKHFDIEQNFKYNLTDEEIKNVCERLPSNYWTNFIDWLKFTSGMKQINRKDIWDEINKTKPNYDKLENEEHWDKTKNKYEECSYFEYLCKEANTMDYINLSKYKPVPEKQSKPDKLIDMPYLTGDYIKKDTYENGFDYDKYDDIVIQSDTGTAKSSSFKEYIIKSGHPFVSIVSRISLAKEQYEDFSERIEGVDYYAYDIDNTNAGLVTCIDSIMKISGWAENWNGNIELENRVVFLDEFNSLVEYVLNSSTMKNKRIEVFNFLVNQVFMKAKKIVCADADISDISMKFIEYIRKRRNSFTYIQNTHIHNKGTPATELFSKEDIVKRLSKEKTFMCACDSKSEAIDIYTQLIEKDPKAIIKLIVARDDKRKGDEDYIDLKSHAKIIFSPKIVYGNDSNGYLGTDKRPVYAYYKELTISPTAMLQQINRERKIEHLYYCFDLKLFCNTSMNNSKQALKVIEKEQKEAVEILGRGDYSEEIEKMFIDLSVDLVIKHSCYDSNKYAHFKTLLPTRGFIDTHTEKKKTNTKQSSLSKKINNAKFSKENFIIGDCLNSQTNMDVVRINNTELMRKNRTLFTNAGAIEKYILQKTFYLKDKEYCERMLNKEDEIEFKKINSNYYKVSQMLNLYDILGYNKDLSKKSDYKETFTEEQKKDIMKQYKGVSKTIDLNDEYKRFQFIIKITKNLFGKEIVSSQKKQIKGKRQQVYSINKRIINNLYEIQEHQKRHKVIKPNTAEYTKYYMEHRNLN